VVKDDGDTCQSVGDAYGVRYSRMVWWFEPQNHWQTGSRFGPQNPGGGSEEAQGGTWRHRMACVEVKLSHEGCMAVGSAELRVEP
jgi:hypothetical protein